MTIEQTRIEAERQLLDNCLLGGDLFAYRNLKHLEGSNPTLDEVGHAKIIKYLKLLQKPHGTRSHPKKNIRKRNKELGLRWSIWGRLAGLQHFATLEDACKALGYNQIILALIRHEDLYLEAEWSAPHEIEHRRQYFHRHFGKDGWIRFQVVSSLKVIQPELMAEMGCFLIKAAIREELRLLDLYTP